MYVYNTQEYACCAYLSKRGYLHCVSRIQVTCMHIHVPYLHHLPYVRADGNVAMIGTSWDSRGRRAAPPFGGSAASGVAGLDGGGGGVKRTAACVSDGNTLSESNYCGEKATTFKNQHSAACVRLTNIRYLKQWHRGQKHLCEYTLLKPKAIINNQR